MPLTNIVCTCIIITIVGNSAFNLVCSQRPTECVQNNSSQRASFPRSKYECNSNLHLTCYRPKTYDELYMCIGDDICISNHLETL